MATCRFPAPKSCPDHPFRSPEEPNISWIHAAVTVVSLGNSRSYSTAGSLDIWKMALFPLAAASTKEHHGGKMQRMWRSRNEVLRLIWTKSEPVTGADKHHDVTTGLQSLFLMRLHLDNLNPARSGGRELKHFGCGHAETQGQGWGW